MCHRRYDRSPPAPAGTAALPPKPQSWHCHGGPRGTGVPHGVGCLWVPGGFWARDARAPQLRQPRAPPKCCSSTPKRARGPQSSATPLVAALASARALAGAGGPGHALPAAGAAECGTLTRQSLLVINRAGAVELVNPSAAGQAAARALPRLGGRDAAPGTGTERRGHGGCARITGQRWASRLGWGTRRHRTVWDGARGPALLPSVPVPAGGGCVTWRGHERWRKRPGTHRHPWHKHPRGHARPCAAARSPPRAGRGPHG